MPEKLGETTAQESKNSTSGWRVWPEVAPFCGLRVPLGVVLFLSFHVIERVPILRSVRVGETFPAPNRFTYPNQII